MSNYKSEMDDWKESAQELQQFFCEGLGDRRWDHFRDHQRWSLEIKVATALFEGIEDEKSKCEFTLSSNTPLSKYSEEKRNYVRRICDIIYKTADSIDVRVAFIFVVGICDNDFYFQPVFKVQRSGGSSFIDSLGNVYQDWWDYKANNKLPAGEVCYPNLGNYMTDMYGVVWIHYADTPAGRIQSGSFANIIKKGLSFLTICVDIASLFIPAGGFMSLAVTWIKIGLRAIYEGISVYLGNGVKIAKERLYKCFAKLFERSFPLEEITSNPSKKIVDLINSTERFALSKNCTTENYFMDFFKYICIYLERRVKDLEKCYQRMKNEAKKLLGDTFNEVDFANKHGIENVDERESAFITIINDSITESKDELREKYKTMLKEITAANEDGGLKFVSNHGAMDVYLCSCVVDGEELSVSDFFSLIRGAVENEHSTKTPGEEAPFTHYSNGVVSVSVHKDTKILQSVKFLEQPPHTHA